MAASYCTWEQYVSLGGLLEPNAFHQFAIQAEEEIRSRTYGRADEPPESMRDNIARCMRDLVGKLQEQEKRKQLLPAGVHSVNNDGLSVTADSNTNEDAEIHEVCRKHLLRPVNLMYPGVKR